MRPLAAVSLALALLLPLLASPAAADPTLAACGGVAPAQTACEDGPFLLTYESAFYMDMLGFVGVLVGELVQDGGSIRVVCTSAGAFPNCVLVEASAVVGQPTIMRCTAHPFDTLAEPPPAGPWGCRVATM